MKVAVASSGGNLDAQMDPRFGRCAYIVVVDTDTMQFEAIENPGPAMGSGAGTSAAQIVGDTGAETVVAGNLGPNAALALNAGGVTMLQASGMTVAEAAQAAAAGELPEVADATTGAKSGIGGGGAGAQQGDQMPGGGRGMGGGMGQGMDPGMGQPGYGQFGPQMSPGMMSPGMMGPMCGPMAGPMGWGGMPGPIAPEFEEEMRQYHLSMLRAQAEMLEQQLEFIQSQIEYLESQGE